MRNSILVVLVLLLNACGGEAFSAEFDSVGDDSGGEAGEAPVTAAGGSATAGTSSTGGVAAGQHAGGSAAVAGSAAGGAAPGACDVDIEKITAALPMQIVWKDFINTNQDLCVWCRDEPCETIKVISWGVPTLQDGQYVYLPNTDLPMIPMNIGVNDGACTKTSECGAKLNSLSLAVTVDETKHVVVSAHGGVVFQDNMCITTSGVNTGQMALDLGQEMADSLKGLKIPCAP